MVLWGSMRYIVTMTTSRGMEGIPLSEPNAVVQQLEEWKRSEPVAEIKIIDERGYEVPERDLLNDHSRGLRHSI